MLSLAGRCRGNHNESALDTEADIRADIAFRRSGPGTDIGRGDRRAHCDDLDLHVAIDARKRMPSFVVARAYVSWSVDRVALLTFAVTIGSMTPRAIMPRMSASDRNREMSM
jgi:hypothetical protein